MAQPTLIALAIALLAITPSSIAAGASSASVARPAAVAPATALTASSGWTVESKMEAIRGAEKGSRVATFSVGAYKGSNVIIIQVESLNNFLINKKYGGKEITPNYNKLIKQSWYWPNTYSETGMGNTVDAEFIVNSGLLSPKDQASSVKYANRVIPALPRLLGGAGYTSFTMHANKVSYWNRGQLYKALGFTRYYDRSYFKGVPRMGEFGASDEALFKYGTGVIKAVQTSSTPVYAQLITLSSHPPFLWIPESKRPVRTPSALSNSLVGKYISAESYTDMAFGQFVKRLKDAGVWDKSIIVIYGDHTAVPSTSLGGKDAAGARALLGRSYGPVDRQRIPLIIHLPNQTAGITRKDVAGQVDILPTVTDLVGVDTSKTPHVGRSLFVGSSSLAPLLAYFPSGSFVNGRMLYEAKTGSSKAVGYWVSSDARATPGSIETTDLRRSSQLRSLSDSWVMSLPKFDAGPKGWIPDPIARKAAKVYGFLQH